MYLNIYLRVLFIMTNGAGLYCIMYIIHLYVERTH